MLHSGTFSDNFFGGTAMWKIAIVVLFLLGLAIPRPAYPQDATLDQQVKEDDFKSAITALKHAITQLSKSEDEDLHFMIRRDEPIGYALSLCRQALETLEQPSPDLNKALDLLRDANAYVEIAKNDNRQYRAAPFGSIQMEIQMALQRVQLLGMDAGGRVTNSAVIRVFYATDRAQSQAKPVEFGSKKGDGALRFGSFDVSIPRDHRLANIERPIKIWRYQFSENPEKHFMIVSRTPEDEKTFYNEMRQTVENSEEKEALIFIHGFNVNFDDAVYRTAQIAYDLGFSGVPIVYSWPSNGELQDYTWDLAANEWTAPHLRDFLTAVALKSGAKTIHLIAHSMGNRALVNALSLMKEPLNPHFQHVVLTAPDMDAGTFTQLADTIKSHAQHTTLYVSSHDKALKASKVINGDRRAGDSDGDVVVINGIDTIDASTVDTNFWGHFYYGDNRSVLSDLFRLLHSEDPPNKRFGIRPVGKPPKMYWQFAP